MSPVAATNGQTAMIGTALPQPLQVQVMSDGGPVGSGISVTWRASAGALLRASGVTDGTGLASALWTMGTEPGPMTATSRIAGAQGSPVSFRATALPARLTATVVGGSASQTGVVGTALAAPLRIQVLFGGVPKAGASVHWNTASGELLPIDGTTDAGGFAEAAWTLGTVAQFVTANATVDGLIGPPVGFGAQALAGPAVAIQTAGGSGQTFPANRLPADPLVALVTDRYGNWVNGQAVTWTVERGPVEFSSQGGATDAAGRSASTIAPSGGAGGALVRAALPGVGAADFTLSVEPKLFEVLLKDYTFISVQNHSSGPAVDTIPAGRTMLWTLEFDFDIHGVASVGTPAFRGGDFPYGGFPPVSVRFDTPGTYRYADPYHPSATGILVVQ
jgi:adhesin/invasin